MKANTNMNTSADTKIKKEYFHGIGSRVAKEVGCTGHYARMVLNGKYEGRDTILVRKIKAVAEKLAKNTICEVQVNVA